MDDINFFVLNFFNFTLSKFKSDHPDLTDDLTSETQRSVEATARELAKRDFLKSGRARFLSAREMEIIKAIQWRLFVG